MEYKFDALWLVFPLLYGAAVLFDIVCARRAIHRLVDSASEVGRTPWRPLTTVGQKLQASIDQVSYQWDALKWQLEASSLRAISLPGNDWWTQDNEEGVSREIRETRLFSRLLQFFAREFRAVSCAIVIEEAGRFKVVGRTPHGERFDRALVDLLRRYFRLGETAVLGRVDLSDPHSKSSDLSLFGFRYCLSEALDREDGSNVIIWLGYPPGRPPTELEVKALKEIARKTAEELKTQYHVTQLSEKVIEAEIENKEKSDLMAHMSHDIRSPLNNIKAILTLFKLQAKDAETLELIESAEGNCAGLIEIVEDLLDYSKHRVGKLRADPELIDLSHCIGEVVASFRVTARLKGLQLTFTNLYPRCGVNADRKHLRRILSNILGNALKYTKHGSVKVEIFRASSGKVRIEISDTGLGMSTPQLQALFTPFTRFHAGYEGAGLGLSVTRILTELNSGQISVSSEVGKGSVFTLEFNSVEIPLLIPENGREESSVIRSPLDRTLPSNGLKLLLVDDDRDCLESLKRLFVLNGFEVEVGETVSDAISLCNFGMPDIVITDYSVPSGGGERLLRYLSRQRNQPLVAILSGRPFPKGAEPSGVHRTFQKPANFSEILDWIVEVTEKQRVVGA